MTVDLNRQSGNRMTNSNRMSNDTGEPGTLAGLRVLQFGCELAPQMVGLALADLGADVIRCGIAQADPLSAALEKGKRVADLEDDIDTLVALAQNADVVVGFEKAPELVAAAVPATAIALSLPAFPHGDPRFAGKGTDEGTVLAAAGVLAERGPTNRLRGLGPAWMPMPIASAYAAAFGTLATLAGIFGRQQTGRGDTIEVSLFGALMEGFSYNHIKIADLPERYADPRNVSDGHGIPLTEDQVQSLIDPMYRAFACSDDAWFYIATPPHRELIERLLRLLGLWDTLLADGIPVDDPYLSSFAWKDRVQGSILSYPQLAPHWRGRIRSDISRVMRTQPATYWEQQFVANGLCGTRVQSSAEWLTSDVARNAGLSIKIDDPLAGQLVCAGPFMWARGTPRHKPRAIVSRTEIAWESEAWALPTPTSRKPFLSGTRVLDLCNVIAGPTVAGCLTRFGADVIKIDPTVQDFDPSITVLLSLQSARGKRSILANLASAEGQSVFAQLVADSDLVTFNGTQTQLTALGLNVERLSHANPAIVLAQVSAFGGPAPSSNDSRKGVDEVLQAATGVMHRLKPPQAPPEEYAHFGTIDVATGVWGAAAAVAGLINANVTGKAARVGTSLAAGAAAVQMPFLWRSAKLGPAPDADDCHSGAGTDKRGLDSGSYISPDGTCEPLTRYAELRSLLALTPAEDQRKIGFVRHEDHPVGSPVTLITQCAIACEHTPLVAVGNPKKYGSDTREVLAELGFKEHEIAGLLDRGSLAEQWPNHSQFLPD